MCHIDKSYTYFWDLCDFCEKKVNVRFCIFLLSQLLLPRLAFSHTCRSVKNDFFVTIKIGLTVW